MNITVSTKIKNTLKEIRGTQDFTILSHLIVEKNFLIDDLKMDIYDRVKEDEIYDKIGEIDDQIDNIINKYK